MIENTEKNSRPRVQGSNSIRVFTVVVSIEYINTSNRFLIIGLPMDIAFAEHELLEGSFNLQ